MLKPIRYYVAELVEENTELKEALRNLIDSAERTKKIDKEGDCLFVQWSDVDDAVIRARTIIDKIEGKGDGK